MFISTSYILSALALASITRSAPLNEREHKPLHGWTCHHSGAQNTQMSHLNLPKMVAELCAKDKYRYHGCNAFRPKDSQQGQSVGDGGELAAVPGPCVGTESEIALCVSLGGQPDDDGAADSQSAGAQSNDQDGNENDGAQDDDQQDSGDKDEKKHHHKSGHKEPNQQGQSDDDENKDSEKADKKHKKHHDDHSGAQSFEDASPSEAEANDDGSGCLVNERFSENLKKCVDQSLLSQPNEDGGCNNGEIDALLNLCLDLSLLGSNLQGEPQGAANAASSEFLPVNVDDDISKAPKPDAKVKVSKDNHKDGGAEAKAFEEDSQAPQPNVDLEVPEVPQVDVAATAEGIAKPVVDADPMVEPAKSKLAASSEGEAEDQKCSENQKFSTLAKACVDEKSFTQPSIGTQCDTGRHFDSVLGLCVDVTVINDPTSALSVISDGNLLM